MVLALADTLALVLGPIKFYVLRIHLLPIDEYMWICKMYRYLKYVFAYAAYWLIIVFTIFRVIAVYLPHKANIKPSYAWGLRVYPASHYLFPTNGSRARGLW